MSQQSTLVVAKDLNISHYLNLSIYFANDYLCYYIIHTQHDCPSQMNSNLLISVNQINSLSLVNLLLLINKFSFICEGQSCRVRIAITWTNLDASSVRSFGICLRAILQQMLEISIFDTSLKIIDHSLQPYLPGANMLTIVFLSDIFSQSQWVNEIVIIDCSCHNFVIYIFTEPFVQYMKLLFSNRFNKKQDFQRYVELAKFWCRVSA